MNTLRLVGKSVRDMMWRSHGTKYYRISNSFAKIYIINKLNFRAVQFDRAFPKACRVEVYIGCSR